jgi:photosystem II stability/assembly factor-like uncharacterized protein
MRLVKASLLLIFAMSAFQTAYADWNRLNLNSFSWYKDITFVTKDRGWIVGTDGVILSTDNGGATWQPNKRFTTDNLLQVHFTDERTGWMLCERNVYARGNNPISYLRKTTNGGLTWDKVDFEDIGRERVTRLLFGPDGRATAFGEGGIFYKLQEDGATWKKSASAIHFVLLDGGFGPENGIGAIVGAGGTVMFTEDGGLTWERSTLIGNTDTKFNAISFGGPKTAWAVGNGGAMYRSNGGARLWREQPHLTASNLNDVYFADSSKGWIVGDNGTILRTRDGGNSWLEMNSKVTHKLEKIAFHDGRGFAIGFGGTLLIYDEKSTNEDPGSKPTLQRRS